MGMEKNNYNMDKESEYLYPPEILKRLDFNKSPAVFKPKISAANPGEAWMVVRPLQRADYDKGFLQLLSQLTSVGNVSRKQFDDFGQASSGRRGTSGGFRKMGMEKNNYNMDKESEYLYPPEILKRLDFNKSPAVFKPKISAANPGEAWMVVRPLQRADYDKGFLQLLSQLTSVGNVSRKQFDERFTAMKASGGYFVTVIEDTRINKLIGAATLTIEQKFIHNCSYRGRLEDVVVNDTYRGKQLGKLIVVTVSLLARELGCYKMSLDCKDKLIKFYETLGYNMEPGNSNAMNMRFDDPS